MNTSADLKRIVLHRARDKEFPEGSSKHGYEFIAPLKSDAHIDAKNWKAHRNSCVVRRFWGDSPTRYGKLLHRPGGDHGATWGFDYDPATNVDDEAGFHFDDHVFAPGEYVSIRDADGDVHTFKVVTVAKA
jgi:hypothetical protein